jgi:hypothetical protein
MLYHAFRVLDVMISVAGFIASCHAIGPRWLRWATVAVLPGSFAVCAPLGLLHVAFIVSYLVVGTFLVWAMAKGAWPRVLWPFLLGLVLPGFLLQFCYFPVVSENVAPIATPCLQWLEKTVRVFN